MFSLEKSFEQPLSTFASLEADKGCFVSRGIAPRKNFSGVVNYSEEKSTLSPDVYWEKGICSPGNALDAVDFENRLIRRTSGTKTITMTYDADGNRISKTVSDSTSGTTTTYYLVDTNNLTGYAQVFEELYNNGGNLETYRSYTYGLDLIAQHQLMPPANPTQWETSYYMYDGLGTVRALTSDSGLISDSYTYSAFGEILNTQSAGTATPNTYLFTGEQFDADLGMDFLRARYMNPTKGRMHTIDTWEGNKQDPRTLHKYLYVHANPIGNLDPSGNQTLAQTAGSVGVIGMLAKLAIVYYNPVAMAERAAVALKMQAYSLSLVLRYVAGMRIALEDFASSVLQKAFNSGTVGSFAINQAVGFAFGLLNTDKIIKDFMKGVPVSVTRAVVLGPLGTFDALVGVALNLYGFLTGNTTTIFKSLGKAAIGATFAFNGKNIKKSVFFLASASLGQFYPELIISSMRNAVLAKIDGDSSGYDAWRQNTIGYANLYWDVQ